MASPATYGDIRDTGATFSETMLSALKAGERFTGPEAFTRWGVWSVSSLIVHLRERGWQIDSDRDALTGRAVYYLKSKRRLVGMRYYPDYGIGV